MDKTLKIFLFIFLPQGVWCNGWNIIVPDKIEALEGSCVSINCRFDILDTFDPLLTDPAVGVWYKTWNSITTLVFSSSRPTLSLLKGNITGKLIYRDCTTIFFNPTLNDRGIYNFRIECNALKYTFTQKTVSVDVIQSPPNPTLRMFTGQMEVQEVLEGNAVNLRCSAITLCSSSPPTLTWRSTDRLPLNGNNRLPQQQNQNEIISDLNFTASHLQHGVTFICNITYQLQNRNATAQSNITLRVLYAPKNTSISVFPSNSVLEGTSVTLTCRSDANPAVLNYTWVKQNGRQPAQLQTGQNLTYIVTDRTHTGRYYCRAGNQHGTQNTSVLLDIQYPPKNTSITAVPSSTVLEGNPVTLICNTDANPALVNYTWYRENRGRFQKLQTGYNLTFSITNSTQSGNYYCTAENKHGQRNTSVLLDIQFAPINTSASLIPSSTVLEGLPVTLICNTNANPALVNYTWYKDDGGQIQLLQTGCNLTFSFANSTQSGRYYCIAQNMHGQQNSSVLLDVQYPPKYTSISAIPSSPVLEGNPVTLICSSDANPALINHTWYKEIEGQLEQLQTGDNLTFSVTNTTHIGWYYCDAQNKHGQQNSSFFLDIQYPPKNTLTSVIPSRTILEGNPVTLICQTDANPALVKYTWYRDINGQFQQFQTENNLTFSITNHTHFGWYHCVAQNKHGKQNTSVLLDIQFSPKDTTIFSSTTVLEGNPVSMICSANANPALLNYTWYTENRGQLQQFQTGFNLTLSVTNRGHSGWYHCVAQNKHGKQNTSVMLDIQYASEVSSSTCDKTQQTVCLCEVNGNPSSKVEWFLSGRPITNSTNIFIREERLSKTNLKSYVTLLQSPTLNDILQCVSTNTRGTASTKFQLVASPQETTGISGSSVMIGIVIGVLLIIAFLVIKHLCSRNKSKGNSSITTVEDVTGFNLTNRAAPQENVPSVYATGATTMNYSQSPYYFSNDFTNGRPE